MNPKSVNLYQTGHIIYMEVWKRMKQDYINYANEKRLMKKVRKKF